MSRSSIGVRRARRLAGALALGAALACTLMPASASGAPSSHDDRQRFVSVTRSLEQAPLEPGLTADREWALDWLTKAPDVSVTLCAETLGGMVQANYPYAGQILLQDTFSMAALVIEHPETANDPNAQQLAGVEGALNAYRSILKGKPDARSSALDNLIQTQSRGALPDFIRKAWIHCSAKK